MQSIFLYVGSIRPVFLTTPLTVGDRTPNHSYIAIGPVNKMINMLCVWIREGPDSAAFRQHVARVPDYLWMGHDGLKMNGTNGSQLWDTSFMVQALVESGIKDEFAAVFRKSHDYVDVCQIRVDHPNHDKYYRDETKGGWPFSTRDIGWVVADCTGEGLKAALICRKHGYTATPLSERRLFDAVNILLLMQNDTGGCVASSSFSPTLPRCLLHAIRLELYAQPAA
jgi:squalene cyclase